jgi:hypothetical protein
VPVILVGDTKVQFGLRGAIGRDAKYRQLVASRFPTSLTA